MYLAIVIIVSGALGGTVAHFYFVPGLIGFGVGILWGGVGIPLIVMLSEKQRSRR